MLWGSTANTGQSCMSLERVYVEAPVAEEFVERLVAKANRVRLAVPEPADGELGPFIDDRQADVVAAQIADAVAQRRDHPLRWPDRGPRWAALPASDGGDRRKSRT